MSQSLLSYSSASVAEAREVFRVLIIDGDEHNYLSTKRLFNQSGEIQYALEWVNTFDEALDALRTGTHDVYLFNQDVGGRSGMELLSLAGEIGCSAPIIFLVREQDRELDVPAMQRGAADFLIKEQIDAKVLDRCIRYSIERSRNLEQLRRSEERLRYDAFHDPLTNLPNRSLFFKRLSRSLEHARQQQRRFAVLFLDFDRFKVINDSLGHIAGDQLLCGIAERLQRCVRPEDMVARFGGDEFVILLEDSAHVRDAIRVAERIHTAFKTPITIAGGHDIFTSASIGVAMSQPHYERAEDIIRNADIAMYKAKAMGKARHVVFDTEMHLQAMALLQLETDLRRSLDRQEFVIFYQPMVELETGSIEGFEALLRWKHPERGLLAPEHFLEVAEETGVMVPVGMWVMHQACRTLKSWQNQASQQPPLTVSVNMSSKLFAQEDLIERVQRILKETQIDPSQLKLEITETVIMQHTKAAAAKLTRLKALGVSLDLDDFGTGYSSLGYLHRFPLDTLKIDRTFIHAMTEGGKNLDIIETIQTLGRKMRMKVVAEGIETSEQLETLRNLGCSFGQGYLFSHPLDEASATKLLVDRRCPAASSCNES